MTAGKRLLVASILVTNLFWACKRDSPPAPDLPDLSALRVFAEQHVLKLIPYQSMSSFEMQLNDMLFDTLIGVDHFGVPFPSLAEKWHISPDHKTYTFSIRRGVSFPNGQPLTVHDIVYTLERVVRFKLDQIPELHFISGVEDFAAGRENRITGLRIINNLMLEIHLEKAFPSFLEFFSAYYTSIVPRNMAGMSEVDFNKKPVGSGPFRIEHVGRREIEGHDFQVMHLKRHQLPHRNEGTAQDIEINICATPLALKEKLSFDIFPISRHEIDEIAANPVLRVANSTPIIINFLVLNPKKHSFLQNAENRRHIYQAVNRELIVSEVFANHAFPAHMVIPLAIFGWNPDYRIKPKSAGAAFSPPIQLPLLTVDTMGRGRVAENLRDQLSPHGIQLEITIVKDLFDFFNRIILETNDPFLIGVLPEYPSAFSFFLQFVEKGGFMNFFPRTENDLRELVHLLPFLDYRENIAVISEINRLFETEAIYVPLYSIGSTWAFNKRISALLFKYNAIIDYSALEVKND